LSLLKIIYIFPFLLVLENEKFSIKLPWNFGEFSLLELILFCSKLYPEE